RGDCASAPDAAGREHRDVDHAEDLVEERQETEHAAHMTPRFDALRDYQVASSRGGGARLPGRADLPAGEGSSGVDARHERFVGIAVEELDEPGASGGNLHAVEVEERNQEVDAVGPRRPRT